MSNHPLFSRLAARILQILVGLTLLTVLLSRVDFQELRRTLGNMDQTLLLWAFLSFAVMILLDGVRIAIAFRSYSLSLPAASKVNLVGLFLANFTPGMVGAELYRVYFANRLRKGLLQPITLAAAIRGIGMLTMLGLAALYVALSFRRLSTVLAVPLLEVDPGRLKLLGGALLFLPLLALLLLLPASRLRSRVFGLLGRMREVLQQLGFRAIAALVLVSSLMTAASCVSLHLLLRSLDTGAFLPDMILVTAFLTFASFLPISFGGLGVREGAIVLSLAAFGVASPQALTVALLNRVFLWALALVGGILFLAARIR